MKSTEHPTPCLSQSQNRSRVKRPKIIVVAPGSDGKWHGHAKLSSIRPPDICVCVCSASQKPITGMLGMYVNLCVLAHARARSRAYSRLLAVSHFYFSLLRPLGCCGFSIASIRMTLGYAGAEE